MTKEETHTSIVPRTIEDEMRESYLRYSMSVIVSRALPDVRDGLKPSQRRILYAMLKLNLGPTAKYRKCAKIVGDTSGDYHPHGETVIYPTLVRMAQRWIMRYHLVEGQGNFGSVDGDPPAAMRYTEARLTRSSVQLMEELEKETVDMVPNYDETKVEPVVFPSKFPNLLCNGSSGIAVGMATNIPPHNLLELAKAVKLLLNDPKTTIDDIMQVMPGPDFPTGGIICGYRGIREAYHTGRGKLVLRGVLHTEEIPGPGERVRLVVDELPYNVNKSRLIEQIADLINAKQITGISDLRDESDKEGMRISIDLKRGEPPEVVINQLYKFSDLQVTFGCNTLALDHGMPKTLDIKQLICAWIDHRIEVVRRRTSFELKKAQARSHILEGYLKALDHLDEVVAIVRRSQNKENAKQELIARFAFSDRQASAVLELRLYQLTALERDKIDEEHAELQKKIAYYMALLASEQMIRNLIGEELDEVCKTHGSQRLTQICAAEGEMEIEDLIANEPAIITISQDDYIKRMPIDTFREQRRGGQGVIGVDMKREEDVIKGMYVAHTHENLLIFTTQGRCYWLKVWNLPETGRRSKGKPLINLLEDLRAEERIATILHVPSLQGEDHIFMATKAGTVKKSALSDFSNPRKKGIWALTIDEGDELIAARVLKSGQQVMLFTHHGMAVRFDGDEVRPMGRTARGVRGVSLRENDYLAACEVVTDDQESLIIVCEKGFGKRSLAEEFRKTRRGGLGVRSIITSERNGNVIGACSVTDADGLVMTSSSGQMVRIRMKDVRVMGRSTQGVKLANLRDDDGLVAISKLEQAESGEEEPLEETASLSTEITEQTAVEIAPDDNTT